MASSYYSRQTTCSTVVLNKENDTNHCKTHCLSQFKGTDRAYQYCSHYINNENTTVEVSISSFIPVQSFKILLHFSTAQHSRRMHVSVLIKMFVVRLFLFFSFVSLCKHMILPGKYITDETEDCYFADFAWSTLQRDVIHPDEKSISKAYALHANLYVRPQETVKLVLQCCVRFLLLAPSTQNAVSCN